MPKKLDRHYVSRAERREIRARERRFPALGSAIKTLLEIHGLEAVAKRDHRQRPYEWHVVKEGEAAKPGERKRVQFQMPLNSSLTDWQERCSRPDTWNGLTFWGTDWGIIQQPDPKWLQDIHRRYSKLWEDLYPHAVVHDEVTVNVDFETIEARIAAHVDQKADIQSALTARLKGRKAGS